MELPRVRRWRKGKYDRLYVYDSAGVVLGWADTLTGEIFEEVPAYRYRVDAAFETWAAMYPEDDLATHPPARHLDALAKAWDVEISSIDDDILQLEAMRDQAFYEQFQYLKGRNGEHRVGVALNTLYNHGWAVLHSIPVLDSRADIDHLIIGPGGVFSVNSKAHPRVKIRIDGDHMTVARTGVAYVEAARREAKLVSKVLGTREHPVRASGLVVLDVPRRTPIHIVQNPSDVAIVTLPKVVDHVLSQPVIYGKPEVEQLFAIARQPSSWDDVTP